MQSWSCFMSCCLSDVVKSTTQLPMVTAASRIRVKFHAVKAFQATIWFSLSNTPGILYFLIAKRLWVIAKLHLFRYRQYARWILRPVTQGQLSATIAMFKDCPGGHWKPIQHREGLLCRGRYPGHCQRPRVPGRVLCYAGSLHQEIKGNELTENFPEWLKKSAKIVSCYRVWQCLIIYSKDRMVATVTDVTRRVQLLPDGRKARRRWRSSPVADWPIPDTNTTVSLARTMRPLLDDSSSTLSLVPARISKWNSSWEHPPELWTPSI